LPHFLLEAQLLSPADAVDGRLLCEDRSRRNRNFKVIAPSGQNLLVKQAGSEEARQTLQTEARLLEATLQHPDLRELRAWAPKFVHADLHEGLLVTELVHPATSLTNLHLNRGRPTFGVGSARAVAAAVATYGEAGGAALRAGRFGDLRLTRPFAWEILERSSSRAREGRALQKAFVDLVHASTHLFDHLGALDAAYQEGVDLVHGDARWDNFLVTHGDGPEGLLNLRLIDWEFAGRGDGAWDVAFLLAEYVRFWLNQTHGRAVGNEADLAEATGIAPAAWHESAQALLRAYLERRGLVGAQRAAFLDRIALYLPTALMVAPWEALQNKTTLPDVTRVGVAIAARVAENPSREIRRLWGVRA
jgi:hypothetical protein